MFFCRSLKPQACSTQATSWLVWPAMAETTTAQAWPASTSRFTCAATLRIRSMSATDVPPNLSTNSAIGPPIHTREGPAPDGPAGKSGSFILIEAGARNMTVRLLSLDRVKAPEQGL